MKTMFTNKEVQKLLEAFVRYCVKHLGIKKNIDIHLKSKEFESFHTTGLYTGGKDIFISFKGRAFADVLRTLAHELTHHKQNQEGRIKDKIIADKGKKQAIEDEANVMSGRLVHEFGELEPGIYKDYLKKIDL